MEKQKMIEEGVHKIPPSLPNLLEPQRNELEQELVTVRKHLKNFAVQNDWANLLKESFADRAEIYDEQDKFIQAVIKTTGVEPSTKFPKEFSVCLEKKNIYVSIT